MRTAFPAFRRILAGAISLIFLSLLAVAVHAQTVCNQKQFQARPISLGVSGGNIDAVGGGFCCTGTLGALVQNPRGTKRYVLSNSHVLSRLTQGVPGEAIVQPGLADQACVQDAGDTVATLTRSVPLSFRPRAFNQIDGAIAEITAGDVGDQILNIGGVSGRVISPPRRALGLTVQKMGDGSCLTTGMVAAVNIQVSVQYPNECNAPSGTANFRGQIEITPGSFIVPGDSGSLVVTSETCPRPVGLIFAGSSAGAFANPIGPVLSRLHVKMVTGCTANPTVAVASARGSRPAPPSAESDTSAAPGIAVRPAAADVDRAADVQERSHPDIMKTPGVVGTGVGLGRQPGTVAIEVYVKKDTPETRAAIPAQIEGIPVRIVVTGPVVAY